MWSEATVAPVQELENKKFFLNICLLLQHVDSMIIVYNGSLCYVSCIRKSRGVKFRVYVPQNNNNLYATPFYSYILD